MATTYHGAGFQNLEEAKAYMVTPAYRKLKDMIIRLRMPALGRKVRRAGHLAQVAGCRRSLFA
jgi:hypothetical protein